MRHPEEVKEQVTTDLPLQRQLMGSLALVLVLDEQRVEATRGSVLKYREDQQRAANAGLAALIGGVRVSGNDA